MFGSAESRPFRKVACMFVADLIGIPFEKMQCWDLVQEIFCRERKPLPEYTRMLNGNTVCSELVEKINTPETGCICAYSLQGKITLEKISSKE